MRGRKLLDQTLPLKVAGTLVSLLERFIESLLLCHTKVKVSKTQASSAFSTWPAHRHSEFGIPVSAQICLVRIAYRRKGEEERPP
jgi:hypothetical protein